MDNEYPKILVCTMNAWSEKVGDNTFPMLLSSCPKAHIANIFFKEDPPDFSICEKYFRISEKRIIKSVLKRSVKTGYQVTREGQIIEEENLKQYKNKSSFYYTKLFCREAVWKIGKWRTAELDAFIDDFAPDVIIYVMSRYLYYNNIVRYILKRTKAAGIGCFWDDTFTYKQEQSIGYRCLRFCQRKNLKGLANDTTSFFAITPKTKREADAFFGIDSTVLTKPITAFSENGGCEYSYPLKILYTGNVGIGRLEAIKSIVDALREINAVERNILFDVYTNTLVPELDRNNINTEFSTLHPPISQKEVFELQKKADVLLFVESLKNDNKIARLSFSTKITDYYAAGKCIFAVGNKDLAPIELFADTDSAIVATTELELADKLVLLREPEIIRKYADRAHRAGVKNHSCESIKTTFYKAIFDAYLNNQQTNL